MAFLLARPRAGWEGQSVFGAGSLVAGAHRTDKSLRAKNI
jgi:hypothetical protein